MPITQSEIDKLVKRKVNTAKNTAKFEYGLKKEKEGFLASLASSTGLPQLAVSGFRTGQGVFGGGKALAEYITGQPEKAKQTLMNTASRVQQSVDLGLLGSYKAASTPREVLGAGLQAGTTIGTLGAGSAATAAGRIGMGAITGGGISLGESIEEGDSLKKTALHTATGALTGAAVAGIFEGLGVLTKKFLGDKSTRIAGKQYARELGQDTKEYAAELKKVAADTENQLKFFGEKVASATDDSGNRLYVGSLDKIAGTAEKVSSVKSKELIKELRKYPDVKISKPSVEDIIPILESKYGANAVTDSQKRVIEGELKRMSDIVTPEQALLDRQMYDGLISKNFWKNIFTGEKTGFADDLRYAIRNILRKNIEGVSDDIPVRSLNEQIGLALDISDLARHQQALRELSKKQPALYKLIWDKTFGNPAVTTRFVQSLPGLGKAGQTGFRRGIRTLVTEGVKQINQE